MNNFCDCDGLQVAEKDMSVFFTKIAPDAIEAKSGEVSRQLKKEYESFDIEQQKEMNRYAQLCVNSSIFHFRASFYVF